MFFAMDDGFNHHTKLGSFKIFRGGDFIDRNENNTEKGKLLLLPEVMCTDRSIETHTRWIGRQFPNRQ